MTKRIEIKKLNQKIKPIKLDPELKEYIDFNKHKLADHFNNKLQEADTKENVIDEIPIVFISTDRKTGSLWIGIDEDYMSKHDQQTVKSAIRSVVGTEIDIICEITSKAIPHCSQTRDCNPIQGDTKIAINGFTTKTCSVGFKASYNGYSGFITAGHCGDESDNVGNPSGRSLDI